MTISMTLAETASSRRTELHATANPAWGRFRAFVVATLAALSIVAASAMPAHADRKSDNVLKALAAIAAIAIISGALNDKKDTHRRPVRGPRVPSVCAIQIGSGRGAVVGYPGRCLREEGFTYRLPRECATNIRIYGRTDKFYTAQCLHNAGFDVRPR